MEKTKVQADELLGWFVERILEARRNRERHDAMATDDPSCTIYLAGLLAHMASTPWLQDLDRHGERLDIDVARRTAKDASLRQRMETYRAAADRYLLYLGLWDGLQGNQQGRYYQITEDNIANRTSAYFGFASDLARRLPPPSSQYASIFRELAMHLGSWLGILLSLRGDVLGLRPRLTPGEEFHLTRA